MNYAIVALETQITCCLDDIKNEEGISKKEQSVLHYEYIAEVKEKVKELRSAIVVLKYFSLEDCKIDLGKIKLTWVD